MKDVVQLERELKRAKVKAFQVEQVLSSLSMNTMVEAIKVLQTLVANERETNIQLSLELKEARKEKRARPNEEAMKAIKTQMLDPFTRNDAKAKRMRLWALQVKAYFESQSINIDVDWLRLA